MNRRSTAGASSRSSTISPAPMRRCAAWPRTMSACRSNEAIAQRGESARWWRASCFETRPSGALQHEGSGKAILAAPHPEEAAKRPSRRAGAPRAAQALLPPALEGDFHRGATSQDIADTALVLQISEALDLLQADLVAILRGLERLATAHRDTPCAGRTFGQHAAPISFGYAVAL